MLVKCREKCTSGHTQGEQEKQVGRSVTTDRHSLRKKSVPSWYKDYVRH